MKLTAFEIMLGESLIMARLNAKVLIGFLLMHGISKKAKCFREVEADLDKIDATIAIYRAARKSND